MCMCCMGAHGSAVYSSKRTYIYVCDSDVAGLQRAVLDSVGQYLLQLVAMHLRKTCPKCGAVVHAKRVVCDCSHAFACKRKARCSDDCEPKKAMKCRRVFECEEVIVQRKEEDRVCKVRERTRETHEQTLLGQGRENTYGEHERL